MDDNDVTTQKCACWSAVTTSTHQGARYREASYERPHKKKKAAGRRRLSQRPREPPLGYAGLAINLGTSLIYAYRFRSLRRVVLHQRGSAPMRVQGTAVPRRESPTDEEGNRDKRCCFVCGEADQLVRNCPQGKDKAEDTGVIVYIGVLFQKPCDPRLCLRPFANLM